MTPTAPKPFIFVLMPFDSTFDDIYQLGIKPACEKAGAYAERVDEQIYHERILDRIYNQISKADVIVADLTGKNPNVFYEVGYAHALNKRVVLLTQKADDIPFDLKHHFHIVYDGKITQLASELEKRVRWILSQPESSALLRNTLQIQVNKVLLENDPVINFFLKNTKTNMEGLEFVLYLYNSVDYLITRISIKELGFILYCKDLSCKDVVYCISGSSKPRTFVEKDGKTNILLRENIDLLPGSWTTLKLSFYFQSGVLIPEKILQTIIRIYTESGCYDYPFKIKIEEKSD